MTIVSDRFLARIAIASVFTTACISKQTYIGGDESNADSERAPMGEPTPGTPVSDPESDDDLPEPTAEGEPEDPTGPSSSPDEPTPPSDGPCSSTVLELDWSPPTSPFEIYCTGSPGRPTFFLDLNLYNVSGMALSNVASRSGWRIVFTDDDSPVEAPEMMVVGGAPVDLPRDYDFGDTWYSNAHETAFSASVCSRCDDEITLQAYFTSDEVACIEATTELATLNCR